VARTIDTEGLRRLLHDGVQLVEVLPASEYDEEHLPGAKNIPLRELTPAAAAGLDPSKPVVVYCFDYQ
jgi:rhodanese-related sulfurtransferase